MFTLAELALWALLTLSLQWCVLLWRRFFGKKWFLTYHFIFKFLFQKIVEALAKKKKKKRGAVYTSCPLVNLNSVFSFICPRCSVIDWHQVISVWEHALLTWECKALHHEHALGNFWKPESLNWLEDDSEELEAASGGFRGTGSLVQGGRASHLPCHFGGDLTSNLFPPAGFPQRGPLIWSFRLFLLADFWVFLSLF